VDDGTITVGADGKFPLLKLATYPSLKSANLARRRCARANSDYEFHLRETGEGVEIRARKVVVEAAG
jgi:hypothetical protein